MDVNHENMCIQCVDYEILEEKYNTLKLLFEKIILKGGFKDYVFDSLGKKNAHVIVQTLIAKKIYIPVNQRTTILDIKKYLDKNEQKPWFRCHLISGDKKLENHRTLLGLNIPNKAVLYLAMDMDAITFPPFEYLSVCQRQEIIKDKFIYDEHNLKRNVEYQTYNKKQKKEYNDARKLHIDAIEKAREIHKQNNSMHNEKN